MKQRTLSHRFCSMKHVLTVMLFILTISACSPSSVSSLVSFDRPLLEDSHSGTPSQTASNSGGKTDNLSIIHPGSSEKPNPDIIFSHISIEQGLSQSVVLCILQDSQGFLWFGTQDGLNRYDGYEFKIYKNDPDDLKSLSNDWVTAITEDSDGTLWIGTLGGGVNKFDRDTGQFTRYINNPEDSNSISHNVVSDIFIDPRDAI